MKLTNEDLDRLCNWRSNPKNTISFGEIDELIRLAKIGLEKERLDAMLGESDMYRARLAEWARDVAIPALEHYRDYPSAVWDTSVAPPILRPTLGYGPIKAEEALDKLPNMDKLSKDDKST